MNQSPPIEPIPIPTIVPENVPATPVQTSSEIPEQKKKRWWRKFIILSIIIVLFALFMPIPYIAPPGQILCKPCPTDLQNTSLCPPCPKSGELNWYPSIGQSIIDDYLFQHGYYRDNFQLKTIEVPSPAPSLENPTANWKRYTKTNLAFSYSVNYPPDWSLKEKDNITYFFPPGERSEEKSIYLGITNYKEVPPPPPVFYTYETLRTVKSGNEEIIVKKRRPSSAQYMAVITIKGDYTAEIYFAYDLDRKYDKIFDQILSTFKFLLASPTGGGQTTNLCQIYKEYTSDSVEPNPCQCPSGSKKETVRMTWGRCPKEGMTDCPAQIFKCAQ